MTTDYDLPRRRVETDSPDEFLLAHLQTRRANAAAATLAVDDDDSVPALVDAAYLDRAGPFGDHLTFTVVVQQPDEFTCGRCFLVQHRSRRAPVADGTPVCRDCT